MQICSKVRSQKHPFMPVCACIHACLNCIFLAPHLLWLRYFPPPPHNKKGKGDGVSKKNKLAPLLIKAELYFTYI